MWPYVHIFPPRCFDDPSLLALLFDSFKARFFKAVVYDYSKKNEWGIGICNAEQLIDILHIRTHVRLRTILSATTELNAWVIAFISFHIHLHMHSFYSHKYTYMYHDNTSRDKGTCTVSGAHDE